VASRPATSLKLNKVARQYRVRSWPRLFLVTSLIPGHLFGWGVEWAFAVATTTLGAVTFHRMARNHPIGARNGLWMLLLLTAVSLVGYIMTLVLANIPTGVRDAVELVKPAMVFFSCAYALSVGVPAVDELRRACFVVLAFGVICAFILIFEVPVLGVVVDALYGTTKTAFSAYYVRLSIPFENPNFFGLFAVMSLMLALNFEAQPDAKLVAVSLLAVGLSGSRTAWLTSSLILFFFVLDVARRFMLAPRRLTGFHLLLGVALPLILVAMLPLAAESFQRVEDFLNLLVEFDLAADESYAERVALREMTTALIRERPIFGWGAMKYTSVDIIDNQYYSLLLRFGVPATILLALVALTGIAWQVQSTRSGAPRRALALMWVILAAWLWNGTFLENVRLAMLITIFFSAASARRADTIH